MLNIEDLEDLFEFVDKADGRITILYGRLRFRVCLYCPKGAKCEKAKKGEYDLNCKKCCPIRATLEDLVKLRGLLYDFAYNEIKKELQKIIRYANLLDPPA